MIHREFVVEGKTVTGVELALPGAPLVLAYGKNGFVMCGYLNIETANKVGAAAAVVRGVNTIDDLLKAPIQQVSTEAQKKGINVGDVGSVALARLA